jgi:hypothetical protein
MSVDWAETKMILLEVEQLFNRDDDVKDIHDIHKMKHEIEQHCANSLKDAKDLIKGTEEMHNLNDQSTFSHVTDASVQK